VIKETDLTLADGRALHCYDSGEAGGLTVFWHHGSPNSGTPPEPLFPAAAERGIRWISYDRPGYMSSTARPGRDTATGAAEIHAAVEGRGALERYLASHEFDMEQFTPADQAALLGDWAWMARIAGLAIEGGPDGYIDDELSDVRPWGFEPGQVTVPVLVFHGGQDRMVPSTHGAWLAARCPDAELWLRPDDGHVSVLGSCGVAALDWLVARA
jgi:pimeloyl-ACP methyl ester carboxylesterase